MSDNILNVSSKLGFCGMPLRGDTNSACAHGCVYCFSNAREIRKRSNPFTAKPGKMETELKSTNPTIRQMIDAGIPIHWGGMSDPFFSAPIAELTTNLSNQIGDHPIMYSTKGIGFDPGRFDKETRAFQFSISMNDKHAKHFEPDAPTPTQRIHKAIELKRMGFWVAVRVQPFIPGISDTVFELLNRVDWDYVVIEGLKIVPQSPDAYKTNLISMSGMQRNDFIQRGLLNINVAKRAKHYLEFLNGLGKYKIGMADNDLHFLSDSNVCCGTDTVKGWNNYLSTTTYLTRNFETIGFDEVEKLWMPAGDISGLFTSNRVEENRTDMFGSDDATTTLDYFRRRFYKADSPFSPGMNAGFVLIGSKWKNTFWGKSRKEVLERLSR